VEKDALLAVPANGAGQCKTLGVLADGEERCRVVGVVDPDDFLLDPDTVVELVMLDDVEVVLQQEARDRLHDSGPLRTRQGQNEAVASAPPVEGIETAVGSVTDSIVDISAPVGRVISI
jgi:hypothetical protein